MLKHVGQLGWLGVEVNGSDYQTGVYGPKKYPECLISIAHHERDFVSLAEPHLHVLFAELDAGVP
jgi:hypothetical protein